MRRSSLTLLLALVALSLLALLQPAAAIQFSLRHGEETCLRFDTTHSEQHARDCTAAFAITSKGTIGRRPARLRCFSG